MQKGSDDDAAADAPAAPIKQVTASSDDRRLTGSDPSWRSRHAVAVHIMATVQRSTRQLGALVLGILALFCSQSSADDGGCTSPAQPSADQLQGLIENLPCPQTGRVSFDTSDNLGDSMAALDTIADPAGGYLGVYHTTFHPHSGSGAVDFRISLAQSIDLIHWTRVEVLDPSGASMPTLRPIPGAPGYLLAYEKRIGHGDVVRIRYYGTLDDLLGGRFAAQVDLPRMFSPFNNGTPTILWTRWNHGLRRSVIELGFHYQTATKKGRPGPDREALGLLRGFDRWSARTDPSTDAALDRQGLSGSHGDWRQFRFGGDHWRLYEAQTSYNDFGTWRVVLDSPASDRLYSVTPTMEAQTVSSSFANPIAHEEPAPDGHGQVLVVTMFLFSAQGPGAAGELDYYQPA